jgi:hypothetical protein
MPVASKRPARVVMAAALLAFTLLLGACSTLRWGYSQGSTLSYWWLDRYAGFTAAQAPQVRAALTQWLEWHRREQLGDDVALLEQAAREAPDDLSAAQVCGWWDVIEKKRDRYLAMMAPALAQIVPTLSARQWQQVQQRFDKTNATWRDEQLGADPVEREHSAVKRVVDRAEKLYGSFDRAQLDFITERMRRSPWDAQRWLDERQADQHDTLRTLSGLAQAGNSEAARQEIVRAWLRRVVQPSDVNTSAYRARLREDQCVFIAEVHGRSTAAQRRHAAETLRGWATDLRGFVPPVSAKQAARAP